MHKDLDNEGIHLAVGYCSLVVVHAKHTGTPSKDLFQNLADGVSMP
jgi:hypothetical protein